MSDTQRCEPGDHERIWLQPVCAKCRGVDDRTWCMDNVWSEGCDPSDCAVMPTEYVRADLVTPAPVVAALVEALEVLAKQKLLKEISPYDRAYADFAGAHEAMVDTARRALSAYRRQA